MVVALYAPCFSPHAPCCVFVRAVLTRAVLRLCTRRAASLQAPCCVFVRAVVRLCTRRAASPLAPCCVFVRAVLRPHTRCAASPHAPPHALCCDFVMDALALLMVLVLSPPLLLSISKVARICRWLRSLRSQSVHLSFQLPFRLTMQLLLRLLQLLRRRRRNAHLHDCEEASHVAADARQGAGLVPPQGRW